MDKKCGDCEQELPIEVFGRDRNRKDGLSIYCKPCRAAQARERYVAGAVTRRFGRSKCRYCRKTYTPTGPGQKFCSVDCRWKASAPRSDACEQCGQPFRPRKRGQRFCNRECYRASCSGRYLTAEGYIRVRVPPHTPGASHASSGTWRMPEHRYVLQESLGRPLEKHETVHHINGDKADNRLENLQLRTGKHGRNVAHRCKECGSHNVEAVDL